MNQKMDIYKRAIKCVCCGMDILYIEAYNEYVCLCGITKPRNKPPLHDAREWIKTGNVKQ